MVKRKKVVTPREPRFPTYTSIELDDGSVLNVGEPFEVDGTSGPVWFSFRSLVHSPSAWSVNGFGGRHSGEKANLAHRAFLPENVKVPRKGPRGGNAYARLVLPV
jgi:hypothetical protein